MTFSCSRALIRLAFALAVLSPAVYPAEKKILTIPSGSKIYVEPMDGFGQFVIAAITQKNTPLIPVMQKEDAEYQLKGQSDTEKAGWAKTIFINGGRSKEEASVMLVDKQGTILWGYSVHKFSSFHGKQSTAESIAKHLKEIIASDRPRHGKKKIQNAVR
jgi:hypothetical protein